MRPFSWFAWMDLGVAFAGPKSDTYAAVDPPADKRAPPGRLSPHGYALPHFWPRPIASTPLAWRNKEGPEISLRPFSAMRSPHGATTTINLSRRPGCLHSIKNFTRYLALRDVELEPYDLATLSHRLVRHREI